MRTIDLNFAKTLGLKTSAKGKWVSWALLLLALLVGFMVFDIHQQQQEKIKRLSSSIQKLKAKKAEQQRLLQMAQAQEEAIMQPLTAQEKRLHQSANQVAFNLAAPWGDLLNTLENYPKKDIALLNMSANAEQGSLLISAEAKSIHAMTSYLKLLEGMPNLRGVLLSNHQIKTGDAGQPVYFDLTAQWFAMPAPPIDAAPSASVPQAASTAQEGEDE